MTPPPLGLTEGDLENSPISGRVTEADSPPRLDSRGQLRLSSTVQEQPIDVTKEATRMRIGEPRQRRGKIYFGESIGTNRARGHPVSQFPELQPSRRPELVPRDKRLNDVASKHSAERQVERVGEALGLAQDSQEPSPSGELDKPKRTVGAESEIAGRTSQQGIDPVVRGGGVALEQPNEIQRVARRSRAELPQLFVVSKQGTLARLDIPRGKVWDTRGQRLDGEPLVGDPPVRCSPGPSGWWHRRVRR